MSKQQKWVLSILSQRGLCIARLNEARYAQAKSSRADTRAGWRCLFDHGGQTSSKRLTFCVQ
jgi:hypothetical protein